MPRIPEVPPDQAVLAVPQTLDPPVETRQYTMEFKYQKCTDPHTHTSDTRPELLPKLNGIFTRSFQCMTLSWHEHCVHSFLSQPDCRTKLCWQRIQLFCMVWPWLCSPLPAHNIHFNWQKLGLNDQNVRPDRIIPYRQRGRQVGVWVSVWLIQACQ